ncbi:MAG: LysE family translocator, partial [Chloroflexota bacterium]|nr:LysE family translocator [Chloroflexota bacterium]
MSQSMVLGFAAVSFAIIVVPGPSVLFAISRAIVGGRRHALLTVLGNGVGLFVQVVCVAVGLGVIVTGSDEAYTILKLAGAAYLVWLGISAIRHRADSARVLESATPERSSAPLRDGFVIGVTNPKSMVFLAALLPQYVNAAIGMVTAQMVL